MSSDQHLTMNDIAAKYQSFGYKVETVWLPPDVWDRLQADIHPVSRYMDLTLHNSQIQNLLVGRVAYCRRDEK